MATRSLADARLAGIDPVQRVLSALEGVRRAGKGWIAKCPAHEDRTASLSVADAADGKALLHCFAGCASLEIVHAIGLELSDLFPSPIRDRSMTREERAAMHERRAGASVRAALNGLLVELEVIRIAAAAIRCGERIGPADFDRLTVALDRVRDAQGALYGPRK